jgi:hypothetical protein
VRRRCALLVAAAAVAGAEAGAAAAPPAAEAALPDAAGTKLELFRGFNAPGLSAANNESLGDPPDPTGSVSRLHYVEVVNARIAVYERERPRRPVAQMDATAFWGTEDSTVVDPQIAWDDRARRWYYVMLRNRPNANSIFFAWSKSADPTDLDGGWCRMEIPLGTLFDDFPRLGFSAAHVLIGTNIFDVETRRFKFARVWAIAKPGADAATCERPALTAFGSERRPLREADGRRAVTPVPVVPVKQSRRGFIVAADCIDEEQKGGAEQTCRRRQPRGRQITVWHVSGPPGDPRLVRDGGIAVPGFSVPDPVPQPGTNRRLDASDTRLTQAVSNSRPSGGAPLIWTQHAVAGAGGRSVVRWYALDPRRLSVVDRGVIRKRRNWVFNAAVSPTRSGRAAIINYNVGGPQLLPQVRARIAGSKAGGELTLGRSFAPNRLCDRDEPFCSWGDYAGASPDPLEANVVWGSNQTMARRRQHDMFGSHWATRNFALSAR